MNTNTKQYTLAYFFKIAGMTHPQEYLQLLLQGLRTVDQDLPEGNQPSLIENEDTVAFIESVDSKQLKQLHGHLRQVFGSTFSHHQAYLESTGGQGVMAMTIYFTSPDGRRAVMVSQSQPETPEHPAAFGYQVDINGNTRLTEESLTMVGSGRDAVDAILAFFGELENVTQQAVH